MTWSRGCCGPLLHRCCQIPSTTWHVRFAARHRDRRGCDRQPSRHAKMNRTLGALCDLRLKGAFNHTDWIGADKDGTFDASVRRKCGCKGPDAFSLLKCHDRLSHLSARAAARPKKGPASCDARPYPYCKIRYCLTICPSGRRTSPQPPFIGSVRLNGCLAAAFSSTSMPQPGLSLA